MWPLCPEWVSQPPPWFRQRESRAMTETPLRRTRRKVASTLRQSDLLGSRPGASPPSAQSPLSPVIRSEATLGKSQTSVGFSSIIYKMGGGKVVGALMTQGQHPAQACYTAAPSKHGPFLPGLSQTLGLLDPSSRPCPLSPSRVPAVRSPSGPQPSATSWTAWRLNARLKLCRLLTHHTAQGSPLCWSNGDQTIQ